MQFLKQSTAYTFRIGPFVDSTDGVTAETGLTIAQADIQISKAGGAFAQTSASPTTTHDADGWYQCPLTTTDTNTLGNLTVQVVMAGALPVWKDFCVLSANIYDSLIGGGDLLDVSLVQVAGAATDVSAMATNVAAILVDTGTTLQAELDGIQADTEDIQSRLPAALVSGRMDASVGAMAANVMTAAAAASDLTTELQSGLATAASIAALNNLSAAQVNAEVDTAIADANLATAANLATVAGYLDTEIAAILADTNELQTDWANGGRLDLILDARASQTSVDDLPTNAELATALGTADDATLSAIAALSIPSAATVAGAVRTELSTELARLDASVSTRVETGTTVSADVEYVNGTAVTGTGALGDEWGPA